MSKFDGIRRIAVILPPTRLKRCWKRHGRPKRLMRSSYASVSPLDRIAFSTRLPKFPELTRSFCTRSEDARGDCATREGGGGTRKGLCARFRLPHFWRGRTHFRLFQGSRSTGTLPYCHLEVLPVQLVESLYFPPRIRRKLNAAD